MMKVIYNIGLLIIFLQAKQVLTQNAANEDVTFCLYTRINPITCTRLVTGQLAGSNIDPSNPFKFIIHGYISSANQKWVHNMVAAYLEKGNFNVITVDWSNYSHTEYSQAASNTKEVGFYVALLIIDLHNTLQVPYNNIHIVGHSLGAHVSGNAGNDVFKTTSTKIARITGLDPAGPLFYERNEEDKLNSEDALFVDVIHTSIKFGYYFALGHADFYPNGGTDQPGCDSKTNPDAINNFIIFCSHARSYLYFTESINSRGFIARKCINYKVYSKGYCRRNPSAIMGDYCDPTTRGIFYLTTNSRPPYARNGKV